MPNAIAQVMPEIGSIGGARAGLSPNAHSGPSSYVQAATTGDPLQATEFGMLYLCFVAAGVTSDGLYRVTPIGPGAAGPVTSVKLVWTDFTTGLEVPAGTDLSGSSVSIFAIGL